MKKYEGKKSNVIGNLIKKYREEKGLEKIEVSRLLQLHAVYLDSTELKRIEDGTQIVKNYAGNIEVRVSENEWDEKFANVIMWYENLLRPVLLVYSNKKDDTNAIIDDEKLANIAIEFYSEVLKSDSGDEDFELLKKVINKNRKVKFELCKYIKRGLGWKSLKVVQEDKAKVIKLGLEDKLMDYFISRENEQNK